jgi:hypothetical protein
LDGATARSFLCKQTKRQKKGTQHIVFSYKEESIDLLLMTTKPTREAREAATRCLLFFRFLTIGLGDTLQLVLLLDGKAVGRTTRRIDQLIGYIIIN